MSDDAPKPPRHRREAPCPACWKTRDVDAQRGLVEASQREGSAALETLRELAHTAPRRTYCPRHWSWACDPCLRDGRALAADPKRQVVGMGAPSAHYVDRPFVCLGCKAAEVFTARDQVRWYEELGFVRGSYPKRCAACRAELRRVRDANTELSELLPRLASRPATASELLRASELYETVGSRSKAALFRRRAKKAFEREGRT